MDANAGAPQAVDAPRSQIGASPLWDEARRELLWVDVMQGLVHRYRPGDGASETLRVPSDIGSIVPRRGGGYAMGLKDGYWLGDEALRDLRRTGGFHDPEQGSG